MAPTFAGKLSFKGLTKASSTQGTPRSARGSPLSAGSTPTTPLSVHRSSAGTPSPVSFDDASPRSGSASPLSSAPSSPLTPAAPPSPLQPAASSVPVAAGDVADPWAAVKAAFPNDDERLLQAYFEAQDGHARRTIQNVTHARAAREAVGPVTIRDVAPYLRSQAFWVCLEGARSESGYPILYCKGMFGGSRTDLVRQVLYAMDRIWANMPADRPPKMVWVMEVVASSYRIPDKDFRTAVFDTLKCQYPWMKHSEGVYFLDAPNVVKWGFKIMGNFFDKDEMAKFHFISRSQWQKQSFGISPENRLPDWGGGTLRFDIESYIAERARAEGVDPELCSAQNCAVATVDTAIEHKIRCSAAEAKELATFCGYLWKRGSGGLLGNTKWKRKYFAVFESRCAVYYDSEADARPAQFLDLVGSDVQAWQSDRPHSFLLLTARRKFHLACETPEELETWVGRFQRLATDGDHVREAMMRSDSNLQPLNVEAEWQLV